MSESFKYGTVKIANEIFDDIAKSAANEVDGVYYVEDEKNNYRKKNTQVLTQIVNNKIYVNLIVVLKSDINVLETVEEIQKSVKRQLETMTGLCVDKVNVKVSKLIVDYE
ncbi:MAG: Asp23/Gls24 family envelope stress response protein [Tissierellia bacterium]|nr:Asp23/Gls24 family envelope stress response protein [Tissierellia bacterium]